MRDARGLPLAIEWHEGMLLAPQHFQQADRRAEGLVHYHSSIASPFHWGVRQLRVDEGQLSGGTFRVLELEAVLPDGTIVTEADGPEEGLKVALEAPTGGSPKVILTVHLTVPAELKPGEPAKGALDRYRSVEGLPVPDETSEAVALPVSRIRPRASLIVGESTGDRYESFPLARVEYEDEVFRLGSYVPPCLQMKSTPELWANVSSLVARVRTKATYLSDRIRAAESIGAGANQDERQRVLQALVSELPHLEAVLGVPESHPFELYLALCDSAGALANVVTGGIPPQFKAYDHNNLESSFDAVVDFCTRMTKAVERAHTAEAFVREGDAFRIKLGSVADSQSLLVGVRPGDGMTEAEVGEWMDQALIARRGRMNDLRQNRVLGMERLRVRSDEDLGVVPTGGVLLFRLEGESDLFSVDDPFEISNPSDRTGGPSPGQILLYVATEESEGAE